MSNSVAHKTPLSMGLVFQARMMAWVAFTWLNPRLLCLPHCRWILYHLSHCGSPKVGIPTVGVKPGPPGWNPVILTARPKYRFSNNSYFYSNYVHSCSVTQSCLLTLCDPMDFWLCSPPGSSVHGIFQARILEWVAISSSRGPSSPRDWSRMPCGSCMSRQILYH